MQNIEPPDDRSYDYDEESTVAVLDNAISEDETGEANDEFIDETEDEPDTSGDNDEEQSSDNPIEDQAPTIQEQVESLLILALTSMSPIIREFIDGNEKQLTPPRFLILDNSRYPINPTLWDTISPLARSYYSKKYDFISRSNTVNGYIYILNEDGLQYAKEALIKKCSTGIKNALIQQDIELAQRWQQKIDDTLDKYKKPLEKTYRSEKDEFLAYSRGTIEIHGNYLKMKFKELFRDALSDQSKQLMDILTSGRIELRFSPDKNKWYVFRDNSRKISQDAIKELIIRGLVDVSHCNERNASKKISLSPLAGSYMLVLRGKKNIEDGLREISYHRY